MKYFYIMPFKVQYYLPLNYTEHEYLHSFFTPYSKIAKLFWWIWNTLPFFKNIFTISEEKITFKSEIDKFLKRPALLAFNLGTAGPEQKITIIGKYYENDQKFFIKYSQKPKARELVHNEISVLNKLSGLEFIPFIIDKYISEDQVVLITNFLEGKKETSTRLNDDLLNIMFQLSKIKLDHTDISDSFITSFAHGDFCPWNLLRQKNKYKIIDWEMGGVYPLGYDLFTFIFQTQFLLNPKKSISDILSENLIFINKYFSYFLITDWKIYLEAFIGIKLRNVNFNNPLYKKFKNLEMHVSES